MKDHQHLPEYQSCPETRVALRDQEWVKVYETAASANEPTRIKNAHALKSKGTSAGRFSQCSSLQVQVQSKFLDTYTKEEMVRMSTWALQAFGPSKAQVHLGIRDRAMVLLSTNIAFRGDSTRRLLWSDLFMLNLPMVTIAPDAELPVRLVFIFMLTRNHH